MSARVIAQSNSSFSPSPIQQQVFTLSWLASQAPAGYSQETGTTPPTNPTPWKRDGLQAAIDHLKPKIPSWNWKVVWGPNYAPDLFGGPANTMFIAQQLDSGNNPEPVYVVAIAGTNSDSLFDQVEDLEIDPTDWKVQGDDGLGAQVTRGDFDGVKNLLAMEWNVIDFLDNNVRAFLKGIPDQSKTTLWFTGHSMGGAVAPMLMLALMDPASILDTSETKLGRWKQVNLLATAGPSIGNASFVRHFNQVFSAGNATTTFVWNANDVVPHAWAPATMNELTGFYGIDLPSGDCVGDLIKSEQKKANAQSYVQFEPNPAFAYPLQSYAGNNAWTADSQFMAQLGYQHLNAYVQQFKCTWFTLPNPCDAPKPRVRGRRR